MAGAYLPDADIGLVMTTIRPLVPGNLRLAEGLCSPRIADGRFETDSQRRVERPSRQRNDSG
jgi:hypothetical protein